MGDKKMLDKIKGVLGAKDYEELIKVQYEVIELLETKEKVLIAERDLWKGVAEALINQLESPKPDYPLSKIYEA